MRDISIKTYEALGRGIRTRRMALGLSQAALADRMGVERKWVIRLEAGNHAAEIGNVLKAIEVLDLELKLIDPTRKPAPSRGTPQVIPNVSEVFERLKKPGKRF